MNWGSKGVGEGVDDEGVVVIVVVDVAESLFEVLLVEVVSPSFPERMERKWSI